MSSPQRPVRRTPSKPNPYQLSPTSPSSPPSPPIMNWQDLPPGVRLPPGYGPPDELLGPHRTQPKEPLEISIKQCLKLEPEDKDTHLARICSDALHELPQFVKVGERFSVPGNEVALEKGEILLLLFIAELPRVHAVDMTDNTELWLPVHAEQVYERLPLDPRLDDKLYLGASKLINAKPLPTAVRVVEGYGSDDYTECVDIEDVLLISHVEESSKRYEKQKVLIAKNQIGHRLEIHKGMDCAQFTTMMSALFLHMSEIINLDFPQRVRVVEDLVFVNRRPKDEKVLKLLSYKKEPQVIATRVRTPGLLSIPITASFDVSITSFKEKAFHNGLPAVYPSVNLTFGVKEIGRADLDRQMKEISQPLPETLPDWLESFEGKERACEIAKVSKSDLIRDMKELTNYNKELSDKIGFLSQAERPFIPRRDDTRVAPPRPSKPSSFRRLPPAPIQPPVSPKPDVSKPAVSPKPSPRTVKEVAGKLISKFQSPKRSFSADGYEVPDPFNKSISDDDEGDDYEEVPDVSKKDDSGSKTSDETCNELKMILQRKEKTITQLKEENKVLHKTCKKLEDEKEKIMQSNVKHVQEIHRLQYEIDRLISAQDDQDIYDVINPTERPLPGLPGMSQGKDTVIYNTPGTLMVQRSLISRTDIEGVGDLLRQLGLTRYVDKFKEEEVNGPLLMSLDETVLKDDLGMTGLHARKLLLEIKKHAK